MKQTFLKLAMILAVLLAAVAAVAQETKLIIYADGGASNVVNYVAAATTNTYYLECSEVDSLPIVTSIKCTGASSAPVMLHGYRQLAFGVYETTPFFQQWVTPNGTTAVVTITNLPTQGATLIKFQIGNTNATSPGLTNLVLMARPKASKWQVFPTAR